MNTRLSKASATALLAIVLSLGLTPVANAAPTRDGDSVRERIVQFIREIRNIFAPHTNESVGMPTG